MTRVLPGVTRRRHASTPPSKDTTHSVTVPDYIMAPLRRGYAEGYAARRGRLRSLKGAVELTESGGEAGV